MEAMKPITGWWVWIKKKEKGKKSIKERKEQDKGFKGFSKAWLEHYELVDADIPYLDAVKSSHLTWQYVVLIYKTFEILTVKPCSFVEYIVENFIIAADNIDTFLIRVSKTTKEKYKITRGTGFIPMQCINNTLVSKIPKNQLT